MQEACHRRLITKTDMAPVDVVHCANSSLSTEQSLAGLNPHQGESNHSSLLMRPNSSREQHSAIDVDASTGHESRLIGGQEHCEVRCIL